MKSYKEFISEFSNEKEFKVFYCDLNAPMREALLRFFSIKEAKELNWNKEPLFVLKKENQKKIAFSSYFRSKYANKNIRRKVYGLL